MTKTRPGTRPVRRRPDAGAGGDGPPVPELIPDRPTLKTVRDAAKD